MPYPHCITQSFTKLDLPFALLEKGPVAESFGYGESLRSVRQGQSPSLLGLSLIEKSYPAPKYVW